MGAAYQAKQLRMIVKVFVSCLLALAAASSESSSSESGSGEFRDLASTSPQLRWTLHAQQGLLWEPSLRPPLTPALVGWRLSTPSRLERLLLREGGGGQTRGGNVQLLSRSRLRWDREWKVIGVCSHSWVGSRERKR